MLLSTDQTLLNRTAIATRAMFLCGEAKFPRFNITVGTENGNCVLRHEGHEVITIFGDYPRSVLMSALSRQLRDLGRPVVEMMATELRKTCVLPAGYELRCDIHEVHWVEATVSTTQWFTVVKSPNRYTARSHCMADIRFYLDRMSGIVIPEDSADGTRMEPTRVQGTTYAELAANLAAAFNAIAQPAVVASRADISAGE